MTASKQEPETAEYQLVMKLEIPSKMREEGIRRYIHSQVFRDGWGEAFQTNYIHSKEFRVTRSTHSSQPAPNTILRNAREAMKYLESVESEFEKHFRYAEGKEYEIWGTALNRVREALLRAKGEKLQEPNPCEENGCTDIENCDEICQHSRIYSPIQMQEGKKAAVKAERERVLDAAISTFSNWRKSTKSADSEEMYDSVIAKLESLRGGEP